MKNVINKFIQSPKGRVFTLISSEPSNMNKSLGYFKSIFIIFSKTTKCIDNNLDLFKISGFFSIILEFDILKFKLKEK